MQNLLQLILRYSTFWTFVILEVISFYLVVQYNQRQSKIFSNSMDRFVGSVYKRYDSITDYFTLGRQIRKIKGENASLRSDLTKYTTFFSQENIDIDTVGKPFEFIPAKVIGKSFIGRNNTFYIDQGSAQGIKKHMGVINGDGIVGVVLDVSENYALVMSNFHQKALISAAIKNKNVPGTLAWEVVDTRYMQLKYVPNYIKLEEGDTVISSGNSFIFPKGLEIGFVDSFKETEEDYYDITVRVKNTFYQLDHVYVVNDLRRNEIETLEEVNNE